MPPPVNLSSPGAHLIDVPQQRGQSKLASVHLPASPRHEPLNNVGWPEHRFTSALGPTCRLDFHVAVAPRAERVDHPGPALDHDDRAWLQVERQ